MRKNIFLAVVIVLSVLLSSCSGAGSHTAYYDEEIDADLSAEISEIDNAILHGLIMDDYNSIQGYMSKALKTYASNLREHISAISEYVQNRSFEEYKDIYVKINGAGRYEPELIENTGDENGMIVTCSGYSREMYISMIKCSDETSELLLYIEYTKQNGEWQVYRITIGEYSIWGMDANGAYDKAIELYDKGYYAAAMVYTDIYVACVHPVDYVQYANESVMQEFFAALVSDVNKNYGFPMTLAENRDKQVYSIEATIGEDGIVPVINYITNTQLSDANAELLKEEAYSIHEELNKMWNGFDASFDYFLYRALNEYPEDDATQYNYYATIVKKDN